jgi:hypothetical protein
MRAPIDLLAIVGMSTDQVSIGSITPNTTPSHSCRLSFRRALVSMFFAHGLPHCSLAFRSHVLSLLNERDAPWPSIARSR